MLTIAGGIILAVIILALLGLFLAAFGEMILVAMGGRLS